MQTESINWQSPLGYVAGYFTFTTMLFIVLVLLRKMTLSYPQIMMITLSIALVGSFIRSYFK